MASLCDCRRVCADTWPQVAKKIKYAKFHAARILKALKDGGDPNPPPPQLEERAPSPPPRPTLEEVPDEEFSQGPGNVSLHDESTPVDLSSPYQPSSFLPAPPPRPLDSVSPQELPDAPTHGGYFPPVPTIHEPSSPGLSPVTMGPANTVFPDIAHENTYRFPSPPPPTLPSAPPFQPVPQQPPYSPPPQLPYAPPPPPQQPPYQPTHSAPPPQPVYHQQQINTHIPPPAPARPQLREQDISQAQKYAKWAISALDYEDVDNAILQLRNALATLGAS